MENQIREYRHEKKWSQRDLARAVGSSQQQIQRFEAGVSPVKLELAVKICAALEARIDTLFPSARDVLEVSRKKGQTLEEAVRDTQTAEDLLKAGIEVDPTIWTLKLRLRNGHEAQYRISVADKNRFMQVMNNLEWNPGTDREVPFFCFDSEKWEVAVGLEHLLYGHLCFDFANQLVQNPENEDDMALSVWLTTLSEPMLFEVEPDVPDSEDDPKGQIGYLIFHLDSGAERGSFVSFEDVDGETVYLRTEDIALLEVPLSVTHPELQDDDEVPEADENASDATIQ